MKTSNTCRGLDLKELEKFAVVSFFQHFQFRFYFSRLEIFCKTWKEEYRIGEYNRMSRFSNAVFNVKNPDHYMARNHQLIAILMKQDWIILCCPLRSKLSLWFLLYHFYTWIFLFDQNRYIYILTNDSPSLRLRSRDLEDADDAGNSFFYTNHIAQVQATLSRFITRIPAR
jgi:hypothetical protein